jgi:hypothetical protein
MMAAWNRHQIEGPKRSPKKSAQRRLPQSNLPQKNVEIRTELEKRVLCAL